MTDAQNSQEIIQKIQELEETLGEMRAFIGERRAMLNNADKKLQQFQDTIYAMLIEEDYPSRKMYHPNNENHEDSP